MNKQEAIKIAYGEHWDLFSTEEQDSILKNNGLVMEFNHPLLFEINKFLEVEYVPYGTGTAWRPKSLQGIEDNNGWFKTEDEIPVLWLNFENGEYELASLLHIDFKHTDYTHWTHINLKSPIH